MTIRRDPDGTVLDGEGRVLYFSVDRFVKEIGEGDFCFICGAAPGSKTFNNEHVIPDWVLTKHGLHSNRITLPNDTGFMYGRYTIPCCQECNSQMAKAFENPISELISGGYAAVRQHLIQHGPKLFFTWLALIFLKTHLRDRSLRAELDPRRGGDTIADSYCWPDLHHIHCVARSFYSGARLDSTAFGSLVVLAAHGGCSPNDFDYGDHYLAQTMLLQIGEVTFIAVLNDSCIASDMLRPMLKAITGPLAPLQLREVMARLAYVNLLLNTRPVFTSEFSRRSGYVISADVPDQIERGTPSDLFFGQIFHATTKDVIGNLPEPERLTLVRRIESGRWSFLLDDRGRFINHYAGDGDKS